MIPLARTRYWQQRTHRQPTRGEQEKSRPDWLEMCDLLMHFEIYNFADYSRFLFRPESVGYKKTYQLFLLDRAPGLSLLKNIRCFLVGKDIQTCR